MFENVYFEYFYWGMGGISLCYCIFFFIIELRSSLNWRRIGYKTWGFNKVESPYEGTREFVNNKSWLCKAVYIGNSREFFWSPGGGFSPWFFFGYGLTVIFSLFVCFFMWPIFLPIFFIMMRID